MSILSRSIYTIFFTVGSRNSTKISNFKNKKMMTNELSSFDEFNGISSCLDNTIRFLSQQSKKMKTPIRFLSQLSKKWKLPREQIFAIFENALLLSRCWHPKSWFLLPIVKKIHNYTVCSIIIGKLVSPVLSNYCKSKTQFFKKTNILTKKRKLMKLN
jgi:hypothetical protein